MPVLSTNSVRHIKESKRTGDRMDWQYKKIRCHLERRISKCCRIV